MDGLTPFRANRAGRGRLGARTPRPAHVVFATTNAHKVEEARGILAPLGIVVERPERALPAVTEDGATFAANAAKKARSAAAFLGVTALAEDSGLVVPALGGEPGVLSARYAGDGATDAANNARLVARAEAAGLRDPEAYFVCHAVLAAPDGRVLAQAEGRVAGLLRWPGVGARGFGYDPLFHHPPTGKRLAELADAEKHAVSHRGQALRALARAIAGGPSNGP
jgi:XTP/dITP diphosphohydrolase